MNMAEKIERSKSKEKIDFTKIGSLKQEDTLVKVESSKRIIVKPIWTTKGDFEGSMYADYIASHPEYDGVYVRSELLKRLEKAALSLAPSYTLVVRAGHRPIAVQKRLLTDVMQDYKADNPKATDEEALEHARMYVSDPDIKLPPHCCGAAVDVDMLDATSGRLVDFGSPVNLDSDISHLHSEKITRSQRENRLLLLTAMLDAGFSSYYAEWWHYSYGDEIWAWFYHKDSCMYGLVEV
jgi:D-alanyl-D-alanine dipeptidase